MAITVNPSTLSALFLSFNLRFQDALKQPQKLWWDQVATTFPSTAESQSYPWGNSLPLPREWVGDRIANSISLYNKVVTNKVFEGNLRVPVPKIEDDQYGVFLPIIDDLARGVKKFPDVRLAALIRNLQNVPTYDGKNFYASDHPIDPDKGTGTQQNYWSSGKALTPDNLWDVWQTMTGYSREDGTPLGVEPDTLLVPPQLAQAATLYTSAEFLAINPIAGQTSVGSSSNVTKKLGLNVIVAQELRGDATTWYMLDTSRAIKPFGWQQRRPPRFTQQTAPNSEAVFYRNEYVYGVDFRGEAFETLWWLSAKCVG